MKKIVYVLILFFFLFFFKNNVAAKESAHVLIINQVRGEECCSKGTLANLKMQVEAHIAKKVPAYFALRYDALIDENYIKYLITTSKNYPEFIKLGLLIENTPQLVSSSGVKHNIKEENWFEAQNAYTIGYSQDESKKIVNYLFATFFEKFGYYPTLTSAWMIDTQTLNYLHDSYQVKIHQITREQYGTDSYTLYGGPPHYPYPASRNWLFIPDYANNDPVLIFRQTVTDPFFNYGDSTNTFTSQPNDYMKGNKNFEYFNSLITQTINQPGGQTGFLLLGLENSMEQKYQEEFVAQLELVGKLESKNLIQFVNPDELINYWSNDRISLYFGKDLINKNDNAAYWVTTPGYRVRLIQKNSQVLITDIRLYDKNFTDPYNDYPAQKNGFWIVPYLIDGSLKYVKFDSSQTFLEKLFNEPVIKNEFFQIKNDFENNPDSIVLPNIVNSKSIKVKTLSDQIELSYDKIIISFGEKKISINSKDIRFQSIGNDLSPIKFTQENNSDFKLEWNLEKKTAFILSNKCSQQVCEITFDNRPEMLQEIRSKQYPFIFPEPINRKINPKKSFFYPHNQYAVAGRNPIRLFFSARDDYNLPTIISDNIKIFTSPTIDKTEVIKNPANLYIQYVDLINDKPQKYTATIKVNNDFEVKLKTPVYFAPNCKKEVLYCLTHPIQTYWFLRSFIADKTRK